MPGRQQLLRVVVAALCVTAGIAIVVVLSGSFDDTSWRILGTTSAISVFALLSVPAGVLLERDHAVALARTSVVLTGASFVVTLVVVWDTDDVPSWLWRAWGILLTLAAAAAQCAAVESRRRDSDTRTVSALASSSMATGGLLAALGCLGILSTVDEPGFYRFVGALAILDVLLVVLAAVMRRGTGTIGRTHRVRVNGQLVEAPGRDFAAAVAAAIRQVERDGRRVDRIERA